MSIEVIEVSPHIVVPPASSSVAGEVFRQLLQQAIRVADGDLTPREGFVHDGHSRTVGPVSTVERPAGEERHVHYAKVIAADRVEVHVTLLHRAALYDLSVPVTAAERRDQCLGSVANAGSTVHTSATSRKPAASAANATTSPAAESAERGELEAARDAKYREIRDAELDHRMGKVSREDWRAVDRDLRGEAIEILRELDRLEGRAPS
mgnify:CR=1 FL=1